MRRLALLLVLTAAGPAWAAEEPAYHLDATTTAGYRNVDIDGSKDKYREDYNLRSGLRLFDLDVDGRATKPDTTRLDRFHLQIETPGDEPVQHYRLTAADRSLYDLRIDFTRSKYFYAVPQLFAEPVPGDVRLDDLHDFNFTRTDGIADLTIHAPNLPMLFFGYRVYERHGDATSTVGIPLGDTFLVDAPVDSITHVGRIGTQFTLLGTDTFLQQEYRRVERTHDLGPVRDPAGVDPADPSRLTRFDRQQDEHLDIPATTVRLRRPVGDRLELTGAYFYSHADLGFGLAQARVGTSSVAGTPERTAMGGGGGAGLDTHVLDAGARARLGEHVWANVDYRFNDRSQNGTLDETTTFGVLAARTGDHVRIHSVTTDVEVEPRNDLSLRAGARWSRREAAFSNTNQNITTDTVGAVADARWRPRPFLDLFARYENVQIDDPFTVPGDATLGPGVPERQIALTFTNRATAGVRVTPREWIALHYQLIADSRENDSFAARSRAFANNVALTVTPRQDLTLFASYTRRDVDDRADILLAPRYAPTLSAQTGSEDVVAGELRWDFAALGRHWSTGGDVAWVNVDQRLTPRLEPGLGARAPWALDRVDGGVFVALHWALVEPSVEFRRIDYTERRLPRNDYAATILVFKLTKRWSL